MSIPSQNLQLIFSLSYVVLKTCLISSLSLFFNSKIPRFDHEICHLDPRTDEAVESSVNQGMQVSSTTKLDKEQTGNVQIG